MALCYDEDLLSVIRDIDFIFIKYGFDNRDGKT